MDAIVRRPAHENRRAIPREGDRRAEVEFEVDEGRRFQGGLQRPDSALPDVDVHLSARKGEVVGTGAERERGRDERHLPIRRQGDHPAERIAVPSRTRHGKPGVQRPAAAAMDEDVGPVRAGVAAHQGGLAVRGQRDRSAEAGFIRVRRWDQGRLKPLRLGAGGDTEKGQQDGGEKLLSCRDLLLSRSHVSSLRYLQSLPFERRQRIALDSRWQRWAKRFYVRKACRGL